MHTTKKLIKELKKKHGNCSDYRLAQILDIKKQTVSNWVNLGRTIGDETGLKVAAELGLNEKYVIACLHAEREKNVQLVPLWKSIASQFESVAALLLVSVFALPPF